jgi:FkbM family methyltransferase
VAGLYAIVRILNISSLSNFISRFPLNKKIKVAMPGGSCFYMKNDGSDSIATDIYLYGIGSYEFETISVFCKLLNVTKCFFDIGANTGIYSLIAAGSGRDIIVHSFEPLERAFKLLKKNKEINGFKKMLVNKIAVSDFDGQTTFNVQRRTTRIPLGSSIRGDMESYPETVEIVIPALRLDTYLINNSVSEVSLLKIDTEGTEDRVLKGAENSLVNFRPLIICEVLSNLIEDKLQEILASKNYVFYKITKDGLKYCEKLIGDPVRVSNYLFVPNEKKDVVLKIFL